ncbi:MAG: hypothetical protein JW863_05555 [Chitinispirillaceae bacterium]|nr:hypothetical protein [Chitinispirillaceae bacterium]
MHVINLGAIITGIIVALCIGTMNAVAPELVSGPYADLMVVVLIFITGVVLEIAGLKPRVLHIPVEIVGLAAIGYHLWLLWKWYAVICLELAAIAVYFFIRSKVKKRMEKSRKTGFGAFGLYRTETNPAQKKKLLLDSLISDTLLVNKRDVILHNHEVVSRILADFEQLFSHKNNCSLKHYLHECQCALEKEKIRPRDARAIKDIRPILESVLK